MKKNILTGTLIGLICSAYSAVALLSEFAGAVFEKDLIVGIGLSVKVIIVSLLLGSLLGAVCGLIAKPYLKFCWEITRKTWGFWLPWWRD